MTPLSESVAFGAFELDLETGDLRKHGRLLKLQPQAACVLRLLVSQPGRLVTREEIRRRLWDNSTFVDFDVATDYCVSRIRAVLGDKARAPRYVETLPRRGYRFIAPVTRPRPFAEPTLAVLPFANLNADPATEYFADGVTDALITELARIPAIRVISRQSVLHVKGSSRKLDEIARDLRVDGVVEGSALHEGTRVRVNAQLILVEPERHVWAQSYDCDTSDVLATQRDAAGTIAACVAAALTPAPAATPVPASSVVPPRPVAPEIVDAFLMARAEVTKMSAEGLGNALRCLREITTKAPDFAPGLAEHALCLGGLGYWGHAPIREVYPSAKQMALSAIAIDDRVDAAHLALGLVALLLDWDLAAAERELRRAIELSPSSADARVCQAICLGSVGRFAEASAAIDYALKLAPTSLFPNHAAAWLYLIKGEHRKAEMQARRTIELFPCAPLHGYFVLGWASWRQDRVAEAIAAFEKAADVSREAYSLAFLGHVCGRVGRKDAARSLLGELEQLLARGQAPPTAFAIIHAGLGDFDAAFEWLEKAYRSRDDKLLTLEVYPPFDPLRSDPRYADLVRRVASRFPR